MYLVHIGRKVAVDAASSGDIHGSRACPIRFEEAFFKEVDFISADSWQTSTLRIAP
jgi:hypothetical protein